MKITFIYSDFTNKFARGIAQLSAYLRAAGYQTSLIYLTEWISKERLLAEVKRHNPDILAVSFNSFMFPEIRRYAPWLSGLGIPTIYGGIHPTVAPEECLSIKGIDVICRGEGEGAILDFCNAIKEEKDYSAIANLCLKDANGIIRQNPIRPLVENLDELPFIDYEIFDYRKLIDAAFYKRLLAQASRGCVYNCTYCSNHFLRRLYPNSSHYVRFQSVDRLLAEIEEGLKVYPFAREIFFVDDTLTYDKKWFEEFAVKYRKEIALPYYSHDRFENINEDTACLLKESGCKFLYLGVENGDETFRKEILRRSTSNKKIEETTNILKRFDIGQYFLNIIGAPGETAETLLATISLNAQLRPTRILNSYFYPLKGTDAYEICRRRNYLANTEVITLQERPAINLDTLNNSQIIFTFRYFNLLCKLTKIRLLKLLLSSKFFPFALFNKLYELPAAILTSVRNKPFIYASLRRLKELYGKKCSFRELLKLILDKAGLLKPLRNFKIKRNYDKNINLLLESYKTGKICRLPKKINFSITQRCNLACRMCPYKGVKSKELTTVEIKSVFNNIFNYTGPIPVKLTGGEVFLRDDIFDILDYFDKRACQVSIDTNGTFFDGRIVTKLERYKKVSLVLSIDGFSDFHNLIRGHGSFEKDLEILGQIKNATRINFVILKENIDDTASFYDFMRNKGIYTTFRLPIDRQPDVLTRSAEILNLSKDIFNHLSVNEPPEYNFNVKRLLDELKHLGQHSQGDWRYLFPTRLDEEEVISFCNKQVTQSCKASCIEMVHCNINAVGELIFCPAIAIGFGDLRKKPFERIWFSDKLQEFRAKLVKNNLLPICETCCSLRIVGRRKAPDAVTA